MATCVLDGQDVRVRYRLGGVQDCVPTWGSWAELSHDDGTTLTDLLVSLRTSETSETRTTQGLKSKRVATRVIRGKDTLTGTVHAPSATGPVFRGLRGYYVQIEITYVVTLAVDTYTGVITQLDREIGDSTLTENFTVECDAV